MKQLIASAALALATLAIPAQAAVIRVLGIDTGTSWDYSVVEAGLVSNISFTEVSAVGFASVNLNDYDVLLVSETFTNSSVTTVATDALAALSARESAISAWLAAGHGLVALSEPIGANRWAWLPNAIQPTVGGPLIHDDTVRIVNSSHPVTQGLTDAGLSNWGTSSHGDITGTPGLSTLVDDGNGRAITVAGSFGAGRVVLSLQDADFHNFFGRRTPDQARLLQNAIDWVAPQQDVPEPGTLAAALAGLATLAGARRRRGLASR